MTVLYQQIGQFAHISLANPPVNGLSAATRAALAEALQRAADDDSITYVLLQGAGRGFCAGAEIREFNTSAAKSQPTLADLIAQIESSQKVVVAVLHGMALGGGLELALACHYRLAQRASLLGLPEVKLGLIPGAGGTQRLPRLIDYELARYLILSGELKPAAELADSGLLDALFDQQQPMEFAQDWLATRTDLGVTRLARFAPVRQRPQAGPSAVEKIKLSALTLQPALAPAHAALALEFGREQGCAAGLQKERELFLSLLGSQQSQVLRHLFFVQREAAKVASMQSMQAATRLLQACCQSWLQQSLVSVGDSAALQYSLAVQGYGLTAYFTTAALLDLSAIREPDTLAASLVAQLDQQLIACCQQIVAADSDCKADFIDSLALQHAGWPAHRGGPLSYAASLNADIMSKSVVASLPKQSTSVSLSYKSE